MKKFFVEPELEFVGVVLDDIITGSQCCDPSAGPVETGEV